ncbi:site-specific recombinase XerD [Paraburkholderia unamae]|uniref:site-specific integrase n=1 Tax=Paraburkholderia unamae TaxID=219649 RepID=UPI000DC3A8B3|nr:site-specific integrase [Paraburkholderia unamae]RAR51475.1 site-specific recombinase XerD [Paraburkholderia unamae]
MANHEKFKIDRAFMRALDRALPREYACNALKGFGVRVAPNGTVTYTYRYLDVRGKPKRITVGRWPDSEAADAREKAKGHDALTDRKGDTLAVRLAKSEARAAAQKKVGTMTLGAFLTDRYEDHLRTHGRSGTRNADMIRSKSGFAQLLERDLAAITSWDVEKWRAERLKTGTKPATCNRVINALRGAFSRALEWEIIEAHPMATVKKQREPEPDGDRFLLPDEEQRLRASLDAYDEAVREERAKVMRRLRRVEPPRAYGDATKPAVLLALNLACRRGELLRLEWRHVDLDGARVTFPGINTKNAKSRVMPLNREALEVLTKWRAQCPSNGAYVFPNERGDAPLRELKNWPRVRDAAAISRLRWRYHDLRHHAASRLVMAGVNIYSVSKVLGHKDTRMTARYSHLSPEHMRDTMAALDAPNTIGQTAATTKAA